MPLIKKASKKAFEHNIKAEMEAHPGKDRRKQNIAIAYSVQRKARKKASGGTVGDDYVIRHEEGVNRPSGEAGQSHMGKSVRRGDTEGAKKVAYSTLREGRNVAGGPSKKPLKGLASGGSVESGSRDMNMADGGNVGVHESDKGVKKGPSFVGQLVRDKKPKEWARDEHREALSQLREMPKPKLKGLAEGGSISAANEKRPMPDDLHDDEMQARQNKRMRDNGQDGWTDKPTEKQAMANDVRGKKLPIKRPRMVPSDAFSTRLYDAEGNLEESAKPGPYGEKPPREDDEMDAKKSGHPVRDMEDEHSTHRKPYAKGGEIESEDYDHSDNKHEHGRYNEPMRDDMPSEDEGESLADSRDEEGQDRQGPEVPDMEDEHSTRRKPYAGGGEIDDDEHWDRDEELNPAHDKHSMDDSEDQPMHEEDEEHHNSIAAAIMARRQRLHDEVESGAHDLDEAVRMAEGGEILEESPDILSHGSMDSDDSDQADLSRNHDEDANEEDQASWNALRKENYNSSDLDVENPEDSAQHGDQEESDSENRHDAVSAIRRKMRMRRQFNQD